MGKRLTDFANCAGCAGKLPVGDIAAILPLLPKQSHPNLLVGTDYFDDAGVYKLNDELALVLTVDFFPPLVDDPYAFGQIAAANALSDVYAMGGRPVTGLNITCFANEELPYSVLTEILQGGGDKVQEAGAVVVGGHSLRDTGVKYGLAVTGLIHPDKILKNSTAQAGDKLVLTKPIGSGILTSAAKASKISAETLSEAVSVMTHLNAGACEAALSVGVHAMTDVTGFGLIGHGNEMAAGSGVTLQIEVDRVPLLSHAKALAGEGVLTRAFQATLSHVGNGLDAGTVDDLVVRIIADAQTSGGLLIAVGADRADDLVRELKARQTPAAAIIGEVKPRGDAAIQLV
jgi:selenide,water dikinase